MKTKIHEAVNNQLKDAEEKRKKELKEKEEKQKEELEKEMKTKIHEAINNQLKETEKQQQQELETQLKKKIYTKINDELTLKISQELYTQQTQTMTQQPLEQEMKTKIKDAITTQLVLTEEIKQKIKNAIDIEINKSATLTASLTASAATSTPQQPLELQLKQKIHEAVNTQLVLTEEMKQKIKNYIDLQINQPLTPQQQLEKEIKIKIYDALNLQLSTNNTQLSNTQLSNTQLSNITSTILANINNRMNPFGHISKTIQSNINASLNSGPAFKPEESQSQSQPQSQSQSQPQSQDKPGTIDQNAVPQDSITPNYEAVSGYDDEEGKEPEGVPVATSINPNTGNGYADYPETSYVGNYFAYEFHEEQDPKKYKTGPWVFKEMFSVPPTIDRKPEKLVRKITVTGSKENPTIIIDTDKGGSDSLMANGAKNDEAMDKYYYEYFGKTRIIDGKTKKDKDSSMEYEDNGTHISRMREAMFELTDRKNQVPEETVTETSNNIQNTHHHENISEVKDEIGNLIANIGTQANIEHQTKPIIQSINKIAVLPGESPDLEKEIKEKLKAEILKQLNSGSGSLEDEIKEKLKAEILKQLNPGSGSLEDEIKDKIKKYISTIVK